MELVVASAEVDGGVALLIGTELIVLAGQDGVHDDAHDGGNSQTGQADSHHADVEGDGTADIVVLDADGQAQDHGSDQNVTALGEVNLVFDHIADTDSGDHAVEHQGNTAHGSSGHSDDQSGELGAEGQDDGEVSGQTDDFGVEDLGQSQNAGVLTVGGIGGAAEQSGNGGGQTVTNQGLVQTGVSNVVLANGGGDGAHIANMLHDGCQGDGSDGDDGGDQHAHIQVLAKDGQCGFLPNNGQADPFGLGNLCDHIGPGSGINDHSNQVGSHNTDQNGDDLDHAFAPDVADDHNSDGYQGNQPVVGAAGDGGAGQSQADGDDDGAGDNGREELHDLLGAENLEQQGQDQVE